MDPAIDSLASRVEAVRQAASAEELLAATRALALSDHGGRVEESAIACLVEVLGFNNPGAAVAAVEGLIRLGPSAVDPLLSRLDPRNYGARAWAVRALAGIGDVRGLALLEEALASDVGPSVRRAAAYGLGRLQLEGLPEVERRAVRGRALQSLLAGCRDGEWVVRYAVAVGLELLARSMGPDPEERRQLGESLAILADPGQEETPVVQLRARLALERIAEPERPTRVLFVCLGNICRSPAAEGVFLHLLAREGLETAFTVDSAGTGGWHVGRPADARMRAAAARRGISLPSRARQLEAADLTRFDIILPMDDDNLAGVMALAQRQGGLARARITPMVHYCRRFQSREVPDPYYGGDEGFEHVLDLLEDACGGLLAALRLRPDPARPPGEPGRGTDPPRPGSPPPPPSHR